MKQAANSATLIQNCQGVSFGVPKFSGVISIIVAAPSSPTTAGRRPRNTLFTIGVSMYFMNILLINIINIIDGSTSANVAVALPSTAIGPSYPACFTAAYPQYVAELMPIGPGVI